jgi:hypothetical protein
MKLEVRICLLLLFFHNKLYISGKLAGEYADVGK